MKGRKKHILLVDGYNIINSWPELIEAQSISLDAAREELIDKMAELAGITGEILILVFDSYLQKNATRQHLKRKGIEIVFTKEFETADNYIERLVSEAGKNDIIKVASSDALIQSISFGKGASRISALELKFYYESNKDGLISRTSKKMKEGSKLSKNIVSVGESSVKVFEELEKKFKE